MLFPLENQLEEAVKEYTNAIELNIPDKRKMAIYYANRAFANLKMENYGFAIADSEEAIKADPTYAKGYFRKASALLAIGKLKEAAAFFKKARSFVFFSGLILLRSISQEMMPTARRNTLSV